MSGLAKILVEKSSLVSGSDFSANDRVEFLKSSGACIQIGHRAENVPDDATVIYTSMVDGSNPEFCAAKDKKLPLIHRSDLLKHLMKDSKPLLVTGTHGKTTTTALLAWVLEHAGEDPSYAVGGVMLNNLCNAKGGKGSFFVAEADESDGTFLKYDYHSAILTNIDLDHMDFFKDEKGLISAFKTFIEKAPFQDRLFFCSDDARLAALNPPGISYGFNSSAQLQGFNFRSDGWKIFFDASFQGQVYTDIEIPMIGFHNAQNALAVFGLCLNLTIPETKIRAAFASFKGISRRQEIKGEKKGVLFIDDYAHHPEEIKATLQAIRRSFPWRRICVLFQPHRYSRTYNCLGQYKDLFGDVDEVFVTDIYGACEKPIEGLHAAVVVDEIVKGSSTPCRYVERENLASTARDALRPLDIVVTLGAGDITKLYDEIELELAKTALPSLKLGVVFGGRSAEHEVSILSARNVVKAINEELYDIKYFAISKQGFWITGEKAKLALSENQIDFLPEKGSISPEVLAEIQACDLIFPVLHGTYGEDGKIQGLFEMLGIKYAGCDLTSSAICMDKSILKKLAAYHDLPIIPFISFERHRWKNEKSKILSEIERELSFPLFVKPVHLGSTIGVIKVNNRGELEKAISDAFKFDNCLIVENGVAGREIEFAVYGDGEVKVFPPGEILSLGAVYDFEAKYGENASPVAPEASLSEEQKQAGMALAKEAYKIAGCNGFARVDFFLDKRGQFFLNEINPIPGFTKHSMFPKICERWGISAFKLIDILVAIGLKK